MADLHGLEGRKFVANKQLWPSSPAFPAIVIEIMPPTWIDPLDSALVYVGDVPAVPTISYSSFAPVPINNMSDATAFFRLVTGKAPSWAEYAATSPGYRFALSGEWRGASKK
jgi:hypothetical protein